MRWLEGFLFGDARFPESEEYAAFQFRLLCIVMLSGALVTALLLLGVASGSNPIDSRHVVSMEVFTTSSALLWFALRGKPRRFMPMAWCYEILCLAEYGSALYFVSEDEMRVIWFFTNIPGVYILLGQRAGAVVTLLSVTGLALGNSSLPRPYSPNAMATLLAAMLYIGAFFHVYGARSLSYFVRLQGSNRQLRHLAMHDPLTGLLNARAYYEGCDQMIHLASRNRTPYSVMFVDLDHFKQINDRCGHEAGDLVLKAVANRLRSTVRQSDLVGRVGGEEFSVFLPHTDLTGALNLAEAIRADIEALGVDTPHGRLQVTASIGVARNQHSEQSMADIQRLADQAMYDAKKNGRNRVSQVEPSSPIREG
ncbi:GGDEF domain-containing protein [Uliginosibacterium paludis]|uniref:diguanylate cyclase n=1 Tax=Uliginosibacterium paludis TaxID=1615952 RepID=A0ABV2CT53_9RHOO